MFGKSILDVLSYSQVAGGLVIFTNRFGEVSSSLESVDEAHASPEEIGVSSFFPEITSV